MSTEVYAPVEPSCFAVLCTDEALSAHLAVCENNGFHVDRDDKCKTVRVEDCDAILLDAVHVADSWLVRLDAAYYRHPFAPSSGDAPPGRV